MIWSFAIFYYRISMSMSNDFIIGVYVCFFSYRALNVCSVLLYTDSTNSVSDWRIVAPFRCFDSHGQPTYVLSSFIYFSLISLSSGVNWQAPLVYPRLTMIGILTPFRIACFQISSTISVSLYFQYSRHSVVSRFADKLSMMRLTLSSFWEIMKKLLGTNSIDKISKAISSISPSLSLNNFKK